MSLYLDHLATLQRQAESALQRTGHDALVIAAGIEKYAFLDDRLQRGWWSGCFCVEPLRFGAPCREFGDIGRVVSGCSCWEPLPLGAPCRESAPAGG